MRVVLTKRLIDGVKSELKDAFVWDADPIGFGLKATPKGGRIFVYQYRAERAGRAGTVARRYTIGPYGKLTPELARKRARELAAIVALGGDPMENENDARDAKAAAIIEAQEKARIATDLAFDSIAARWLEYYEREKQRRPSSVRMAELVIRKYLAPHFGKKPLPKISRRDAVAGLDKIPAEQRAMRRSVYAYGRIMFGWAVTRELCDLNPFVGIEKPTSPKARERVLTDGELQNIWAATLREAPIFGGFLRLLLITGQRRSEVADIQWHELDGAAGIWTIPADRAKNGAAHIVPLSDIAVAELYALAGADIWPLQGYVLSTTGYSGISGISKLKRRLDANSGVCEWRLHDMRRTVATQLQKLGTRFEVTEAVLNHVSGAKGGVAGVYQRHDWADEKRTALSAWANRLSEIVEGQERGGNVVQLTQRAG